MAKCLLLNVFEGKIEEVEIVDWKEIHTYLKCPYFDIVTRKIGEKQSYFDIYCDDEGLLRECNIASAVNHKNQTMLVGNLMFAKHDEEGEMIDLPSEDMEYIKKYIKNVKIYKNSDMYKKYKIENYCFLTECDF